MPTLTWIVVGVLAGIIAAYLAEQIGWSLLGYMEIGVLGAVLGDRLLSRIGPLIPSRQVDATALRALLGSGICLLLMNLFMRLAEGTSSYHASRSRHPSAGRSERISSP